VHRLDFKTRNRRPFPVAGSRWAEGVSPLKANEFRPAGSRKTPQNHHSVGRRACYLLTLPNERDLRRFLGALLSLDFDDVRPEDPVGLVAGASSRVDFALPSESIIIGTKMMRVGLGTNALGEELIVDVARYGGHPACKGLFCFVYDTDGMVANPRGLESDLAGLSSPKMSVEVAVRPKVS
jgi:hypothetical protein